MNYSLERGFDIWINCKFRSGLIIDVVKLLRFDFLFQGTVSPAVWGTHRSLLVSSLLSVQVSINRVTMATMV